MYDICPAQPSVTAASEPEPALGELFAIEREMPLIEAERDLLEAQITALDRPANEVDGRRIRRARARVLTARRLLANRGSNAAEVA